MTSSSLPGQGVRLHVDSPQRAAEPSSPSWSPWSPASPGWGESATAARREGSGTKAQVATAAGVLFPICRGAESGVSQLDSSVSSLTSIILWNTRD